MNKKLLRAKMIAFLSNILAYPAVTVTTETVSRHVIESTLRLEIYVNLMF